MRLLLLTTSLLLASFMGQAQDIKGQLLTTEGLPQTTANVILLKAADSSTIKYEFTNEAGQYEFLAVPTGQYLIKFEDNDQFQISELINHSETTTTTLPDIVFSPLKSQTLQTVTVTQKRPVIQMNAEGMTLNVDNTINAVGQNGLELLRKAPGVLVDKDDNLTVNGKTGVRVYIDGKLSPLTGEELGNFLKTLQSNAIDAIEIISNPSAKYDAAGNAGIINIKLKKNKMVGTNGSVNLGYAYGKFSKYTGGLSLNHKTERFNLFGNYNAWVGETWNQANFERQLADSGYNQSSLFLGDGQTHNYKVGADFLIDDKNTVGVIVNGNHRLHDTRTNSRMDFIYLPNNTYNGYLQANNQDATKNHNNGLNLNYQFNNKAKKQSLLLDVDYNTFDISKDQFQPNQYFNDVEVPTQNNTYNILSDTKIDIYTLKVDYEQPLKNGTLFVGTKLTNTNTDNSFVFNNDSANNWVKDIDKSNQFDYTEHIQALYAQYSTQLKSWGVQVGLRAENTITKGVSTGQKWDNGQLVTVVNNNPRNYFNLFPNVAFTYNKNPMNMWNFVYKKRIDRPNYQDLNPFEFKMTDYSYRKGNIALRPQITNAISISNTYKYILNTSIEYAHTTDVFGELIDTINNGKLFQIKENLAKQDNISFSLGMPGNYKKWSGYASVNAFYSMYKADYGGEGRQINLDVFTYSVYGQVSYKFTEWLNGEVSGWYYSPSIWQGTMKSNGMGGIDAGLMAKVLKGKGQLKVSYGDLFKTMKWGGTSNFAGQHAYAYGRWESQQLRINFTYNFGNQKIRLQQRKTGAEDETKRAGESQGIQPNR